MLSGTVKWCLIALSPFVVSRKIHVNWYANHICEYKFIILNTLPTLCECCLWVLRLVARQNTINICKWYFGNERRMHSEPQGTCLWCACKQWLPYNIFMYTHGTCVRSYETNNGTNHIHPHIHSTDTHLVSQHCTFSRGQRECCSSTWNTQIHKHTRVTHIRLCPHQRNEPICACTYKNLHEYALLDWPCDPSLN